MHVRWLLAADAGTVTLACSKCSTSQLTIMCACAQEAMLAFKRLSHAQYATGWVLCCIGRAFFEMVDYSQAAVAFEWAQQADPFRLEVYLELTVVAQALSGKQCERCVEDTELDVHNIMAPP